MSKTVNIKLATPITGHAGPISSLTLRKPVWGEIMQHGRPFEWHRGPDGTPVYVEDDAAISAYAEICVTDPADKTLLEQLDVMDVLAVREQIIAFFLGKPAEDAASKT